MTTLHLHRDAAFPDRTLGRLRAYGADGALAFACHTLEPAWRKNVAAQPWQTASCVPNGFYALTPRTSEKYGRHLLVEGVQTRELILVHAGNWPKDTRGCILPGLTRGDISGDKRPDVGQSRVALDRLLALVGQGGGRLLVTSERPLGAL